MPARFQNVAFWDVWDAGEDSVCGNGPDGFRIADGQGLTTEGHGDGIRVLVADSVHSRLLVKYLKGLVATVEQGIVLAEGVADDIDF